MCVRPFPLSRPLAAVALSLAMAGSAQAVLIAVDNSAATPGQIAGSSNGTISGFTVGNNPNRMLVVAVGGEVSGVGSVTYGGNALTPIANVDQTNVGGPSVASIWVLDSPPVGTADIDVTITGTQNSWLFGALSLTSDGAMSIVATDTAGGTGGTSASITLSPLDQADDYFMVSMMERNNDGGFSSQPADLTNLFAASSMAGGASVTADFAYFDDIFPNSFTWTWSGSARHALAGIAIQATEIPAVPEPASVAVWLAAAAVAMGLMGFRRRRRP